MMGTIAARLARALLMGARLSNEDRQLLTTAVLDRLGALPLHATITIDETGTCFVKGRPLNLETARRLKESSTALLKNYARKLVREQVRYLAISMGVHENLTPEQGLFAKAVLWVMQEEDKLYLSLAQHEEEED